jgi:hypothetical protein
MLFILSPESSRRASCPTPEQALDQLWDWQQGWAAKTVGSYSSCNPATSHARSEISKGAFDLILADMKEQILYPQ